MYKVNLNLLKSPVVKTDKKAVMIGDTKFDAEGAFEAKVDFIGCLYGYGTRQEMERYFPDTFFVTKPSEIVQIVLGDEK